MTCLGLWDISGTNQCILVRSKFLLVITIDMDSDTISDTTSWALSLGERGQKFRFGSEIFSIYI